MAKDKDSKKEKKKDKSKKVKADKLAEALADAGNTSTDVIMIDPDQTQTSIVLDEEDLYESKLAAQAPFAKPLANPKLNKKVLKTIKKGRPPEFTKSLLTLASQAKELRRGVKEVVKALRKGEKG